MKTPVVIAFTPNYFVPASVLISSVLACSKGHFEFICLLGEELPERQQALLTEHFGERASFRYVTIDDLGEGVYVDPRYSAAAEFRLLLPELLPDHDMVLYVDCDFVARNDFAALHESFEMNDMLLAAVMEAPIENQAAKWEKLGCDSENYFNSGFLVMNLKQMRAEGTSRKLMDALKTDYLEFPDQDALNIVCRGRVIALPPVWNSIRTFYLPQYKPDFLKKYTEKDWTLVQIKGNVHYTGGKPWNVFTSQFDLWWDRYFALPADIRAEWKVNTGINLLGKFYLCGLGHCIIDCAREIYRNVSK